jgi:hypothetical protein
MVASHSFSFLLETYSNHIDFIGNHQGNSLQEKENLTIGTSAEIAFGFLDICNRGELVMSWRHLYL